MAAPHGYLTFQGIGFKTRAERQFNVLCGENPPTPTGGYAKWGQIDRPLMDAVTVPQGYDPISMQVEVRFGRWTPGWQVDDTAGQAIEADIASLEWMAGSRFKQGPSPVVYMNAYGQSGDTPLVPADYQGLPWIIPSGIAWGKSIRNQHGYRIWQDASFTLWNYLGFSNPPKQTTSLRGGYFISAPGKDTALLIAQSPSARSPLSYQETLARRIVTDPKNKALKLRSIRQAIPHGRSVWLPTHQV